MSKFDGYEAMQKAIKENRLPAQPFPLRSIPNKVEKAILLSSLSEGSITPTHLSFLKDWCRRRGFKMKKWFPDEALHRAFRLVGSGDYDGIVFTGICRATHPCSPDNPKGHWRQDGSVILELSIGNFYYGMPLARYNQRLEFLEDGTIKFPFK